MDTCIVQADGFITSGFVMDLTANELALTPLEPQRSSRTIAGGPNLGELLIAFSGYNQHHSQELLAFLLDGLHEDLNRVKQKPYIETKDSNGLPDEEVDVCQGQYKSTLVCPVCDKIPITFDPFMYLSLPLSSTATLSMTVTVFDGDDRCLPMPFTVSVSKHGYGKDLYQALCTECCLGSDETLVLAEVYDHNIYGYLEK